MGFDAASRFKIVDQAVMQPGVCLISKSDKGPFVDTGMELNKFDTIWAEANQARIYLSVDIIRELAEGAGLFDEVRDHMIPNEVAAHQLGYTEGVEAHGDLAALADRLDTVAARLRHGGRPSDPVVPQGEDGAPPVVLVTDGDARGAVERGESSADGDQRKAPRQGARTGGKRGRAVVSGDSGDGANPFRI